MPIPHRAQVTQFMMVVLTSLAFGVFASSLAAQESKDADKAKDKKAQKTESEKAPSSEAEWYQLIREKLTKRDADGAGKAFAAALKEYPDSARLNSLHYTMYSAYTRARNYNAGREHIDAHVEYLLKRAEQSPRYARSVATYVRILTSAYTRSGRGNQALSRIDQIISAVESIAAESKSSELDIALSSLRGHKVQYLLTINRAQDAEKLLDGEIQSAGKALQEQPDNVTVALNLIRLMRLRPMVVAKTNPAEHDAAQQALKELVDEQIEKHKDNVQMISAYLSSQAQGISSSARRDPESAEKTLLATREFMDSLDSENNSIKNLLKSYTARLKSYERTIEAGKKQLALLGKPAHPLEVEAWVNGDPISDGELEGKVVLLDFWAVWCGPCIATFPHLREWNDKYSDKGLVIIGMTRYYNYDWDEKAKRPKRVDSKDKTFSPEDEQAAMVKFAEHHELKHRFAVMPKASKFSTKYGVTGIPQAVLIDRKGIVRLIRVGSGEQNAHDLNEMIQSLVEGTDTAAGDD